jgi:CDP-paratose 2-epimerase
MLEAIAICERLVGRELEWKLDERARIGDHRWWISDLAEFRAEYPDWDVTRSIDEMVAEIYERNAERWLQA